MLWTYFRSAETRNIQRYPSPGGPTGPIWYPQEVRRLIYTTNAIEGFNRQLRKVTKAKSVFPTDDSLLKMLYLAIAAAPNKYCPILTHNGLYTEFGIDLPGKPSGCFHNKKRRRLVSKSAAFAERRNGRCRAGIAHFLCSLFTCLRRPVFRRS